MPQNTQQGVARAQDQADTLDFPRFNWDDLKLFLEVAERGSFRAAATALATTPSTVMRRIEALEHALKVSLFRRSPDGVQITKEGLSILEDAHELKDRIWSIERKAGWKQRKLEGTVALATPDGLGAFWIGPQLQRFQQSNPRININLKCSMTPADVLRTSADLSIQYLRPSHPDLKLVKLGRLHVWPYASKSYIQKYGMPTEISDFVKHRFVVQVANQLDETIFLNLLGVPSLNDVNCYRAMTSTAHYTMVLSGLGIGGIPTYLASRTPELVPLPIEVHHQLEVYLTYHENIGKIARVRRTIDWLKASFDASKYPWFADDLIHPEEISRHHDNALKGVEIPILPT